MIYCLTGLMMRRLGMCQGLNEVLHEVFLNINFCNFL